MTSNISQKNSLELTYINATLEADREIFLAAVKKDGLMLRFASERLQADQEVVLAAAQQNMQALQYASLDLKNHPNFGLSLLLIAVRANGLVLKYLNPIAQAHRKVVLAAVQQNRKALRFASEALQKTPEIFQATAPA